MPSSATISPFLAEPQDTFGGTFVPRSVPASPVFRPKHPWFSRVTNALATAYRRHRSRQLLAAMDAHLLKDIGVTYAEAEAEANKRFWQG